MSLNSSSNYHDKSEDEKKKLTAQFSEMILRRFEQEGICPCCMNMVLGMTLINIALLSDEGMEEFKEICDSIVRAYQKISGN